MASINVKSSTFKLSDALLAMMGMAALREDRCLTPTGHLKGAVRQKTANKLIELGLARECRSKAGAPVWRKDDKSQTEYSMKLTVAGIRAVPVSAGGENAVQVEEPAIVQDLTEPTNKIAIGAWVPAQSGVTLVAVPRPGSKIADVLDLLVRKDGASIDELMAATGWLPHTTRAALTGLRRRGYVLERARESDTTRYKISTASDLVRDSRLENEKGPNAGDDAKRPTVVKSKQSQAAEKRSRAEPVSSASS